MRVLIADDEPMLRKLLGRMLEAEGHAVVEAKDGDEAVALLEADPTIEMALLDWMMPKLSGLEVCRRIRAQVRPRYLYIVILTGRSDPDDIVGGLDAGADEYLIKPYQPAELSARLRAAQRFLAAAMHARSDEARALYARTHDVTTGVLNRAAVLQHIRERPGAVCVLRADIDHFGDINARYGHAAGDMVLREVSRRLVAAAPSAVVGRAGSDDFLAVAAGIDDVAGRSLARRVVAAVAAEPILVGHSEIRVTVSVDVVPPGSMDVERVLASAEALGKNARRDVGGRVHTLALSGVRT